MAVVKAVKWGSLLVLVYLKGGEVVWRVAFELVECLVLSQSTLPEFKMMSLVAWIRLVLCSSFRVS